MPKIRNSPPIKFTFSIEGIAITGCALIDTRRQKLNELYPVAIRITYQARQVHYKANVELTVDQWKIIDDTSKTQVKKQRQAIQNKIDIIKNEIVKLQKEKIFSFDMLNSRLVKGPSKKVSHAFDRKIQELKSEERLGNAEYYSIVASSIKKFAPNLKFSEIKPDWLKKYERWLLSEGRTYTTISMYMRGLRSIVNDNPALVSQYPFARNKEERKSKYGIPKGSGRKLALTIQQIGEIARATELSIEQEKHRDLWLFSYFANGMNFTDLIRLKYKNWDRNKDELHWLREKTKIMTRVKTEIIAVVRPEMKTIIQRWGNPGSNPDEYIFPYLYNGATLPQERNIVKSLIKSVNRTMKTLGESLGIGPVTTYVARHSYATVLKRAGVNVSYISEALGHSDIQVTTDYLDSFESDTRKKASDLLADY